MASSLGSMAIHNVALNSETRFFTHTLPIGNNHIHSQINFKRTLILSCAKTVEPINTTNSDASLDSIQNESLKKNPATFPNGFEALVMDVCDETQIAELKVKVGEFEMHLTKLPVSNISPTAPPPVPTEPVVELKPATPPPSPLKSSSEKTKPFVNVPKDS
ncbi:hypothetical protein Lalb_Chr22g0359761 [Lupinus albus]|uniref:Biotin carboxyl carrier protein of acetyl-CoA carboxylase n=1 Tax=Lupinus albus TaxID=3870 RepID=A0A6A4N9Y2_LUPAL|nr:hypothetical protein Lalb_Chr22g0359761 [Lupinus albus]